MGAWQERGRGSSGPHMTRPDPEQLACVARAGSSREAAQHSEQHPHLSQSHSLAAVVTGWSRSQAGHSSVSTDAGVEGGVEAGWVVAQCTAAASLPCQPSPHHAWRLS